MLVFSASIHCCERTVSQSRLNVSENRFASSYSCLKIGTAIRFDSLLAQQQKLSLESTDRVQTSPKAEKFEISSALQCR